MENLTLYDFLKMSTNKSSLRSVFITDIVSENCLIINVEAYDSTGYNSLNTTVTNFDKFTTYLNKMILKNYNGLIGQAEHIRINIYSDVYPIQYILTKDGNIF